MQLRSALLRTMQLRAAAPRALRRAAPAAAAGLPAAAVPCRAEAAGAPAGAPLRGARCVARGSVAACAPAAHEAPLARRRALTGRTHATAAPAPPLPRSAVITGDPANNVPESIFSKMGQKLHTRPDHPLCILKEAIHAYFDARFGAAVFAKLDDLHPLVSTAQNFDQVLVPADHVSRSPNDTYYVDATTVLRCHTSAHQVDTLRSGASAFLITGDVYRRDAIDATHYPVFHQMEGVRVFTPEEWAAAGAADGTAHAAAELKATLEGLARHLFGPVEVRWVDAYFPFTEPSYEMEIFFNGQWLEVLGCGVMQQSILDGAGGVGKRAWAFGLGLERLAMVLFGIPDIRLFWSDDERFTRQFRAGCFKAGGAGAKFSSFSKYPPCLKDVSFWLPQGDGAAGAAAFTENNLCEVVRGVAGDLAEEVKLVDEFLNKKTGKTSRCYRVVYRSMERSLTDEEINALQNEVRKRMVDQLKVELR